MINDLFQAIQQQDLNLSDTYRAEEEQVGVCVLTRTHTHTHAHAHAHALSTPPCPTVTTLGALELLF